MATGIFSLIGQQAATIAAIDSRVTALETEVKNAGGDSTLSTQVTALRTDLTALQTLVGQPDPAA